MKYDTNNTTCRNCQAEMPEQSLYCPKCSQKNTDGRIPILSFVLDAFESIFNIDSKLFKTSLGLLIPGKLTNEFFKGKHKSFATPSRLFIAIAILFFAMTSLLVQSKLEGQDLTGDFSGVSSDKKTKEEIIAEIENIKENFPGVIPPQLEMQFDSMEARALKDTLRDGYTNVTFFNGKRYKFKQADFENLSADSMIQKYNINDFWDQVVFKKVYKLGKDPRTLITTVIGNLTWMMLLLIPSLALVFKLLYIRREKYYVEHLVFLFHTHAFILLIGAIALAGQYFEIINIPNELIPLVILGIAIYTLFAMKMVYKQGWLKTLFKAFVIFISYVVLLVFCSAIIGIVSFLLF